MMEQERSSPSERAYRVALAVVVALLAWALASVLFGQGTPTDQDVALSKAYSGVRIGKTYQGTIRVVKGRRSKMDIPRGGSGLVQINLSGSGPNGRQGSGYTWIVYPAGGGAPVSDSDSAGGWGVSDIPDYDSAGGSINATVSVPLSAAEGEYTVSVTIYSTPDPVGSPDYWVGKSYASSVFIVTEPEDEPPACTYSGESLVVPVPWEGGGGGIFVETQPSCPWQVGGGGGGPDRWIYFLVPPPGTDIIPSGMGSGGHGYVVLPNNGPYRSGSVSITGGFVHTIQQEGAPSPLPVWDGACSDDRTLRLFWAARGGELTTYRLERSATGDPPWTLIYEGPDTEFEDTERLPGVPVFYRVTVIYHLYEPYPPSAAVEVVPCCIVPDAPVLEAAVFDGDAGTIELIAAAQPGVLLYQWWRAEEGQPPGIIGATPEHFFTDTDPPDGELRYFVIALNDCGPSQPSNILTVGTVTFTEAFMALRHKNLRGMQIGIESALGSPVVASKRLYAVQLDPQPVTPRVERRVRGIKAPVGQIRQKGEHTTSPVEGAMAVNDLLFMAAMALCAPVVTTPATAVTTQRWAFKPDSKNADVIKSATCEVGSSEGAARFAGARLASLELGFSNDDMTMGGEMIGQVLAESGVVLSATPEDVPLVMLHADSWEVYVTSDIANFAGPDLSAYRLSTLKELTLAIDGRAIPHFFADRSNRSYSAFLEGETGVTGSIDIAQEASADLAIMEALRNCARRYCRVEAKGPIIEDGFRYRVAITFPFSYIEPARGEDDNLHTGEYDLRAEWDETFDGFLELIVDTDQPATLLDADAALAAGQFPNALVADPYDP